MIPYITASFMLRTKGDRPDIIPDGCVNFAFLGQFTDTPRDAVFTTEYSVLPQWKLYMDYWGLIVVFQKFGAAYMIYVNY